MTAMTRILIASDHRLFRECLVSALHDSECGDYCVEVVDPDRAEEAARTFGPQIVLLDASVEYGAAAGLTRIFASQSEGPRVIVVGLSDMDSQIVECIEAGAKGYVLKEWPLNSLLEVLKAVQSDKAVCSPRVAYSMFARVAELAESQRRLSAAELTDLTDRELQVLGLVADGLGNKEIAAELNLSLHTVKNHVHNILEKLAVHDRRKAVTLAENRGLLGQSLRMTARKGTP